MSSSNDRILIKVLTFKFNYLHFKFHLVRYCYLKLNEISALKKNKFKISQFDRFNKKNNENMIKLSYSLCMCLYFHRCQ